MPIYQFTVRRSGNLLVPCQVQWRLEGTGTDPIPASRFPGGVLPSGLASFGPGEATSPQQFELLAGERPTTRLTGRIALRLPVDCRIDPAAALRAIEMAFDEVEPPPGGWTYTQATCPLGPTTFGPPGAHGQRIVRDQTFTTMVWSRQDNTDFVDCRLTGEATGVDDYIGQNIRLFNPLIIGPIKPHNSSNTRATYTFYFNLGKGALRRGFVIFGGRSVNLNTTFWMETKGFDPNIINHDLSQSGVRDGIKLRTGARALIVGCRGLRQVSCRGYNHAVVNCPGCEVQFWAGTTQEDNPVTGKYPRCAYSYAAGVRTVSVGHLFRSQDEFPALRCVTGVGQARTLGVQTGWREANLSSFAQVLALG